MKKLQANRINFLKRLEEARDSRVVARKRTRLWLPGIVLCAVVLGVWAFFLVRADFLLPDRIEQAQSYLAGEEVAEASARSQALQSQRDGLMKDLRNLTAAQADLDTYPEMSGSIYLTVLSRSGDGVHLLAWDFERASGYIYFQAAADSVEDAAALVARLRETDTFGAIGYYGYTAQKNSSQGYVFSVTAVLTGGTDDE